MSPETTGVDHALRNALMVEVENFFTKVEVFQCGRSSCAHPERILVIGNRNALLRCKNGPFAACDLMRLATLALTNLLISEMCGRGLVVLTLLFHGDSLSDIGFVGWDLRRAVPLRGGVTLGQNRPLKALFRRPLRRQRLELGGSTAAARCL